MLKVRGRYFVTIAAVVFASACGARVTSAQVAARSGPESARNATSASVDGATEVSGGVGGTTATTTAAQQPSTGSPGQGSAVAAAAGGGDNGGSTDVGVTRDTITLGLVTTMSGPVPGLFAGAATGALAAAAYQNSQGGVFGRKIKVDVRDDQFDASQERVQTEELANKAFAIVGGFSTNDDAGVSAIEHARMPDVQVPLTPGLQNSPYNFSVSPVVHGGPTGPWNFMKQKFPDAITAVGGLTTDVPASTSNYADARAAAEAVGYKWVYYRAYQPTETDFTADIIRMKSAGVKFVFTNAEVKNLARIVKTMQQQNFKPAAILSLNAGYDATFIPLAGSAADGVSVWTMQAMYLGEDISNNSEVRLMSDWLQRVKPGFKPDVFSTYGWGSMRLFIQALQSAGPRATRAGVLDALRKIDNFDSNGLFSPAGPASKRPATCFLVVQVVAGKWQRAAGMPPSGFQCQDSVFVQRH